MRLKKKKLIFFAILFLVLNFFIIKKVQFDTKVKMYIDLNSNIATNVSMDYIDSDDNLKKEDEIFEYDTLNKDKIFVFNIGKNRHNFRLKIGVLNSIVNIKSVRLKWLNNSIFINASQLNITEAANIKDIIIDGDSAVLYCTGDSSIVFNISESYYNQLFKNKHTYDIGIKVVSCIILDILLLLFFKKSKSMLTLTKELKNNRFLIYTLSKNDFKTKYAGSYLGIIWAFINPLITIIIYNFVFQYGLKATSPKDNVPFVIWLMCGLIPWFFFQEAIVNATNSLMEYSYLVKKVVFKVSILPIVKILSSLYVHLAFVIFLILACVYYKIYPDFMYVQLIYYTFCAFFLSLALSYATSAIVLFFRDLNQIISILLQIGMWMTPIMWSYTMIPKRFQWIAKLNPMYYVVEGYRDTVINKVWFIDRYFQSVYFWTVSIAIFLIGAIIFKKLKPHFADIL